MPPPSRYVNHSQLRNIDVRCRTQARRAAVSTTQLRVCARAVYTSHLHSLHSCLPPESGPTGSDKRPTSASLCVHPQHTLATARLPELSAVAETRQKEKCQHRVDTFGLAVLNKGVNVRVPSEFAQCQCDVLVA
jgi:hypothetical protein